MSDLLREYRADMVRRGLLPSTITARLYELRRWIGWCDDRPFDSP